MGRAGGLLSGEGKEQRESQAKRFFIVDFRSVVSKGRKPWCLSQNITSEVEAAGRHPAALASVPYGIVLVRVRRQARGWQRNIFSVIYSRIDSASVSFVSAWSSSCWVLKCLRARSY